MPATWLDGDRAARKGRHGRKLTRRRTTRRVVGILLAALAAAAVFYGVDLAQAGPARHHPGGGTALPPSHPSTTAPAPGPPFAVGLRTMTIVDPTRTVSLPGSDGHPSPRTLSTSVYYPSTGAPSSPAPVPDAPVATRSRPFPLVVFGPGYKMFPSGYGALLETWARSGYVVAAPTFPLTNPATPGGPDENDIVQQPADMHLVIDHMLGAATNPASTFHGAIRASAVAVAGQSDGAEAAAVVAFDTCCRDPRVRASILMAGQELDMPGGGTYFPSGSPPVLVIQGTADDVNPSTLSDQLFQAATAPKFYLQLPGADHLGPFTGVGPAATVVDQASVDFLDAYLKGDASALARLSAEGNVAGVAQLQMQLPPAPAVPKP